MRGFVFVLLMGCAHWPAVEPDKGERGDAAGVVLADDESLRFFADAIGGRPVVERRYHFRARILEEAGASLAHVNVGYSPAFGEVVSFRARTIGPDGKERQFGRGDATDRPQYPSFVLYSDERALTLELSPRTPGTLVEYEYVIRYRDWRFESFTQGFGDRFPERQVRFSVSAPVDWEVEHAARRLNQTVAFAPSVETVGQETRYTWEQHDLPALPHEMLGPGWGQLATTVHVRLAAWMEHGVKQRAPRDAAELSAWYHRTVARKDVDDEVRRRAHELVKDVGPDPALRARRLYNWVRDHVSYCAIEVGVGGWRPHRAGEVLGVRYGDCKDKANLLRELLEAVEVPSRLTWIFNHHGYPRRFALAAEAASFNHAILSIDLPGGTVLADPTSRTAPFGRLPWGDEEADVLPLSAAGNPIAVAPASRAEDNREELTLELTADGGDLEGTFALVRSGAMADDLRDKLIGAPAAAQDEKIGHALRLVGARAEVSRVAGGEAPEAAAPVEAGGRVHLRGALTGAATQLLRLSDLMEPPVHALPSGRRVSPVALPVRLQLQHRCAIALPGVEVSMSPEPLVVERPFGRYELRRRREGERLIFERSFTLREHVFVAESYREVKAFFDEILAAEASPVTLRKR
jgi:Domain of Unknown Function with PDB structure (DUF3857)/Transglutaminase-like superfamily